MLRQGVRSEPPGASLSMVRLDLPAFFDSDGPVLVQAFTQLCFVALVERTLLTVGTCDVDLICPPLDIGQMI